MIPIDGLIVVLSCMSRSIQTLWPKLDFRNLYFVVVHFILFSQLKDFQLQSTGLIFTI